MLFSNINLKLDGNASIITLINITFAVVMADRKILIAVSRNVGECSNAKNKAPNPPKTIDMEDKYRAFIC